MNKSDFKLIVFLLFLILILTAFFFFNKTDNNVAKIYYKNELKKEFDMNKSGREEYQFEATNGPLIVEYNNGKIRVKEETSRRNLCSIQGYISKSYQTIICLPNEVVIKIEQKNNLDTIVK